VDAAAYNYPHFPLDMDDAVFAGFRLRAPAAGDVAPDGPATDLATGERVPLSALWRSGPAVIEFGSYT
jgi:hypothetical protein